MSGPALVVGERVRIAGAVRVSGIERVGVVGEVAHAPGPDVLVRLPLYDAGRRLVAYSEVTVRAGRLAPLDDAPVRFPTIRPGERAPEIASTPRRRRRRR